MEKLNYEDGLMLENILDRINELIEEVEYLGKRIDRHWKYHRVEEERRKGKVNNETLPSGKGKRSG